MNMLPGCLWTRPSGWRKGFGSDVAVALHTVRYSGWNNLNYSITLPVETAERRMYGYARYYSEGWEVINSTREPMPEEIDYYPIISVVHSSKVRILIGFSRDSAEHPAAVAVAVAAAAAAAAAAAEGTWDE
jgi:hypothetical protein